MRHTARGSGDGDVRRALLRVSLILLATPVLCAFTLPGEFARLIDAGNRLYGDGKFKAAAKRYESAKTVEPDSPRAPFNLGAARYRLGDYEEALSESGDAARGATGELKVHAEYNAGNCAYRMQKLDEAINRYKRALTLDPDDLWAKHNLEMALQAKEQQKDQQKDQQDQDDEGDEKQDEQQEQEQEQPQDKPDDQQSDQDASDQQPGQSDQQQDDDQQKGDEGESERDQSDATPLTREQAAQLLSSLAREDANMQKIIRRAPMTPERATDKDW